MEGLKPGRIVYFVFDEHSAACVRDVRERLRTQLSIYPGNPVAAGDIVPAIVTAVFGGSGYCNLKVLLDGFDTFWATSVEHDQDIKRPRSWHWMFDGQQTRYRPDRVESTAS